MARHSALTSGSFVIQFLDDVLWEESDLNIYIQKGEACLEFSRYLCEEEGYWVIKAWNAGDNEDYADYEIINVCMLSLSKCVRASQLTLIIKIVTYKRAEEDTEIRIACTHDTPLSSILREFHTTALLNVMTWNLSYSLFPHITFLSPRETYPLQEMLLSTLCESIDSFTLLYLQSGLMTKRLSSQSQTPRFQNVVICTRGK
jgi:hypothetical protein